MTDTYDKLNHWYGWNGHEIPVHPDSYVHVVYRSGNQSQSAAKVEDWTHDDHSGDIIAFRITRLYVEPRKPREWWVHVGAEFGVDVRFDSHAAAVNAGDRFAEIVHVREVLPESTP